MHKTPGIKPFLVHCTPAIEWTLNEQNMRPDKAKVIDEIWDEPRIESFLDKAPMGEENAEFSILLNAYRSMRPEDFARFIDKFKARGGHVDALDNRGRTLLDVIATHAKSEPLPSHTDAPEKVTTKSASTPESKPSPHTANLSASSPPHANGT